MKYVPRDYQWDIENFGFDLPRSNIFAGCGTGKTPATLALIDRLRMFGMVQHVLVLAPKRVAVSSWIGERDKFEDFVHLDLAVAVGTAQQRIDALGRRALITTCTYDLLPWLVEHLGADWFFDMVVCDEVTRVKSTRVSIQTSKLGKKFLTGQGGVRGKALCKVAFSKVKRWVGLSGTPAPNGIEDLWALLFFVDMGQRLGTSFTAYVDRFFQRVSGGDGYTKIRPLAHSQREIEKRIKDVCLTIEAKDYFDLPPLIENIVRVELPPSAMKKYKEMEKELFTEIQNNQIEAFSAGAKSIKCLQIASGAAYINDAGDWVDVHDAKLDALESIIEEAAGMPVLVAYQFKSDLARILKRFKKARHLTDNPQIIKDFNDGKIPILVAHPKSAGHGISLQHGSNIMVFFSTGWALEDDLQFQERIGPTRQAQSGYNRSVFLHRLVAFGTLEEDVVERLKTKTSVQDTLLRALKRKHGSAPDTSTQDDLADIW